MFQHPAKTMQLCDHGGDFRLRNLNVAAKFVGPLEFKGQGLIAQTPRARTGDSGSGCKSDSQLLKIMELLQKSGGLDAVTLGRSDIWTSESNIHFCSTILFFLAPLHDPFFWI